MAASVHLPERGFLLPASVHLPEQEFLSELLSAVQPKPLLLPVFVLLSVFLPELTLPELSLLTLFLQALLLLVLLASLLSPLLLQLPAHQSVLLPLLHSLRIRRASCPQASWRQVPTSVPVPVMLSLSFSSRILPSFYLFGVCCTLHDCNSSRIPVPHNIHYEVSGYEKKS